jgi:hypothetical protein
VNATFRIVLKRHIDLKHTKTLLLLHYLLELSTKVVEKNTLLDQSNVSSWSCHWDTASNSSNILYHRKPLTVNFVALLQNGGELCGVLFVKKLTMHLKNETILTTLVNWVVMACYFVLFVTLGNNNLATDLPAATTR